MPLSPFNCLPLEASQFWKGDKPRLIWSPSAPVDSADDQQ